jgi:hypothetical protein
MSDGFARFLTIAISLEFTSLRASLAASSAGAAALSDSAASASSFSMIIASLES